MSQDYLIQLTPDSVLEELPLVAYRVSALATCKEVRDYFQEHPTVPGVLVIDPEDSQVKAMVSRRRLLERLSRPYALDVFLKRAVADLPEFWGENASFLKIPGMIRVAEGLSTALSRGGESAYEPIVVETDGGDCLLDIGDLLVAHARIFQLAMELLDRQQRETQRYLQRLEDQQNQIQSYTRALELQQLQLQARSESLEEIQRQLFNMADVFATQGGQAFADTFEGIDRISDEINRIVEDSYKLQAETLQIRTISEVIDEIAGRINLLAFNTAVESERAGSQGKGLAVLASEVRRLARETTQAAKNIQKIAQEIQSDTEHTVVSAQSGSQVAQVLKEKSQAASSTLANLRALLQELTESSQQLMTLDTVPLGV
jgi:Methyl-accepting chemotaxis protein (MCP) signalling domain